MNVGDLVTFSSRGLKLEAVRHWYIRNQDKPIVGLITDIRPPRWEWMNQEQYIISWVGAGPKCREHYTYGSDGYWHRCDLKFVAKAKK